MKRDILELIRILQAILEDDANHPQRILPAMQRDRVKRALAILGDQ